MRCTLCHGDHIAQSTVQERIPVGNDIVLVSIEVLVCRSCGERFYDRTTMRRLEELDPHTLPNGLSHGTIMW